MRTTSLLVATLAPWTLLSACASGPSGPPPLDPVGRYTYSADAQGMAIAGTMMIEADGEGFGGQITSSVLPPISISSVVVEGQAVTIRASGPEGPLLVEMVMSGNAFKGTWSMGAMGGGFSGTKDVN